MKDGDTMMKIERFHIKSRSIKLSQAEADFMGVKRVYNWTSHIDYMHEDQVEQWTNGLHNKEIGERILVESAMREIEGQMLYISTCIVFFTEEGCNVFYIKNQKNYKQTDGFLHLLN